MILKTFEIEFINLKNVIFYGRSITVLCLASAGR